MQPHLSHPALCSQILAECLAPRIPTNNFWNDNEVSLRSNVKEIFYIQREIFFCFEEV